VNVLRGSADPDLLLDLSMTLRKRSLPEEVRSMEGVGDTLTAARNTMQTKAHSCVPQRAQRVSDGEPLKRRSTV